MWKLLTQVFGSRNQRLVKELSRTVAGINAFEPSVSALTDPRKRVNSKPALQRVRRSMN